MTRTWALALVWVAFAAPAGRRGDSLAAQTPPAAFRARADSVAVDVSVRQRGRPVTGLHADDFVLRDNGVRQEIADLAYERLPIDVTVALDVSESVTGAVLEQLHQSVRQLAEDLGARDRLRVVTFNARISQVLGFAASPAARDAAFNPIHPFGGTALYDAVAVTLAAPAPPDRRQLVVVFSDGEDSDSITGPDALLDVARRTTPTVSFVLASSRLRTGGVKIPASAEASARERTYEQLARETGGIVETVDAGDPLSGAFRRMLTEFRTSYVLHFVPNGVDASGFHTLDVQVGRPGVEIRARRGYAWK